MPRVEYARRFATDLASVSSPRIEGNIVAVLDALESFGGIGSPLLPASIKAKFGDAVRKVAVGPFDLIYSFYPDRDLVRVEALVHQRQVH